MKALEDSEGERDLPYSTVTDIHEVSDAAMAAESMWTSANSSLVRQTDLVVAAAETGKVVNLKKGQFMSPEA
jgi:2-dehydro-3-deoxyphosphooctonate aldolase (KDO 8-P synthase)